MRTLPANTRMGAVRLRVADLERQMAFYTGVLGLHASPGETGGSAPPEGRGADGAPEEGRIVSLRARPSGPPLVVLEEAPGAPPAPRPCTGLFHVALLLPTRSALAAAILRIREAGWRFQGFADHAVSEAVYLADAEANGLELYADRPREAWRWEGEDLYMTTEPLDLEDLVAEAGEAAKLDERTTVGHVHLRVSSLEAAERFYVGRMGFDVMVRGYPGALFVAAGGYHHHLGLNEWAGRGIPRPPPGSRGLVSFEVVVPDEAERARLLSGGDELERRDGALEDQDGNVVRVVGSSEAVSRPTAGN